MANQKIMGALLARNAALSAGAPPAEASRAAIIGTVFPNPIMGALIGRSLAKKSDVAKPSDGGKDKLTGGYGGREVPAAQEELLADSVGSLADSVGTLAGSVDKSAAAIEALARAGASQQSDPNRITVEKTGAGNPSQASPKKT